jgi:hypothetical protein
VITGVRNGLSNIPSRVHANACCDQSVHNGMCYYYTSSRACQVCHTFLIIAYLYVFQSVGSYTNSQYLYFQQLDLVSPFQLYFNPILIVKQYQVYGL